MQYNVLIMRGGHFRLALPTPMPESLADEAARKIPGAWVEACDAMECELDRQRRAIVARLGLLPLQMSDVARRATTDA